MRKRIFAVFVLFLCVFLLSVGLRPKVTIRPLAVGVDFYARHGEKAVSYSCHDSKKIGKILNYLRNADSRFPAEEKDLENARDIYILRVRLANGKCHIYQQLGEAFFRRDGGDWVQIPKGWGKGLKTLERSLFPKDIFP